MKDNDRAVVGFTALGHALFHTYELSIPVFVTAWLGALSASQATLGLTVGVGYALVGLGALPSGALADRYSSRTLVVVCMVGMAAGFGALAVAPGVVGIAAALAVWGAAASLYHPSALALLSRATEEQGRAFALHGAAGNVGTAVGPLVAALLLAVAGWRTVAGLLVVPALVAAGVALTVDFDERTGADAREAAEADGGGEGLAEFAAGTRRLFTGGFVVVFAIVMLYGLYYRGVLTFLPAVLADVPGFDPVTVGVTTLEPGRYVYAGLLVLGIAGQYAGGRATDERSPVSLLVALFAALVVVSVAFPAAAAAGVVPLLGVCALLGFLVYAVAPVYQAAIAEYTETESRGVSYGFTYLGMFGIGALGAAVAGSILAFADATTLFLALAVLAALAGGISFALRRR